MNLKSYEYYRTNLGVLYLGSHLDIIPLLKEKSDLILTSPPYDNLRNYEGYRFKFELLAKELYKNINIGGVCVWIVGDATIDGSETGSSFKQALYFKEIGFNLHDTMIYQKSNFSRPEKVRYHQTWEYMFIFSNEKPRVFNPIFDRKNKTEGEMRWGKGTMRQYDGEMKKQNKSPKAAFYGMRHNVWLMNTSSQENPCQKIEHPATFPEKLANDHIMSWTNENAIVLDPMAGSGTTLKMAEKLNRRWIGIEISEKYCEIAKQRIKNVADQFKMDLK